MKNFVSLALCLICAMCSLSTLAQDYQIPESMPANNGELEWLVYKTSGGDAVIAKKDVVVKSKTKTIMLLPNSPSIVTMSYAKLPINLDGDFYLSTTIKPNKVDDQHLFGLPFNVLNEGDYNAILFDNQFCYFVRVVNGLVIQGMNDRVAYKYKKAKNGEWTIGIERKNYGDYVVTLNGLEVRTLPASFQFPFPAVGACVTNKGEVKITGVSYQQWAPPAETE